MSEIENRNPWKFFLITYIFTWSLQISAVLLVDKIDNSLVAILAILGSFGPSLTAIFLVFLKERTQLKNFILSWNFKIGFSNFLLVFFISPLFIIISSVYIILFSGLTIDLNTIFSSFAVFLIFPIILVIGGPLAEEYGWRGYAMEPIIQKYNFTMGSLIIGVIHALWHLPLFFLKTTFQNDMFNYSPLSIIPFLIAAVLISYVFTYTYYASGKKLFTAFIFHAMFNVSTAVLVTLVTVSNKVNFPVFFNGFILFVVLYFVTAVFLVMKKREIIKNYQ